MTQRRAPRRRLWPRRLPLHRLTAAGMGRLAVFLAGGAVFYALLEFGPLTTIAVMAGMAVIGAAGFALHGILRRRAHQRRAPGGGFGFTASGGAGAAAIGGLDWTSTPSIPFGQPRRTLGSSLSGSPGARLTRPRYFLDPLVAGGADAGAILAGPATPDIFVGFTLRRRFEEALDHGKLDDAARIIAEMAETTDNQAWCVNANRRLAYHRARLAPAPVQAAHH